MLFISAPEILHYEPITLAADMWYVEKKDNFDEKRFNVLVKKSFKELGCF